MPKDDVLERLNKREAGISDGILPQLKKKGDVQINQGMMLSFKDVLQKTIGEYQQMVDTSQYKDQQDKQGLETTSRSLRSSWSLLNSRYSSRFH